MIEQGIIVEGEPIELLDGLLVLKDRSDRGEDPMSIGKRHAFVVQKLVELNAKLKRHGCHLRVQSPIAIRPDDEPEPDGLIAAGTPEKYLHRIPSAKDVSCVIEAADSSLEHDQTTKLAIYAKAGISQYLIVNLVENALEEHAAPRRGRYTQFRTYTGQEKVALALPGGKRISIAAGSLLP